MVNLILCGGSGTRLWPISRTLMPKQFIKLFDEKSLFQLTVKRNKPLCSKQLIVSNVEQYFLALDQLNEIGAHEAHYLLEPTARNTAPAIALACFARDPEEIMLVTPSDHLIKNHEAYRSVVEHAKELAQKDFLVTFGITPEFAETGFGYIEANDEDVQAFHEKPNQKMAETYVQAGNYFWNSGMFCFKAGIFLEELQQYSPAIYDACKAAFEKKLITNDMEFRITLEDMQAIPEDSIDYAVMEKSRKVKVVTAKDIDWNDVGSFDALYQEFPKDEQGNTIFKRHVSVDSKNNLIVPSNRAIATVDIEDLIIVDTPDALLISKKGSSQKVKKVVAELKNSQTEIHNIHLTAHRPWGTYTVLEDTPGYKIKRIVVNPGKRLSLQKHFHRNEHWIVVSGTATVTVGTETRLVRPNESTYIRMGEVHRLANDGKIPIVLIEAQVGEYTGEDDIIRIEDEYNRI